MADSAARVRVFSDDGKCVSDAVLMRRALEYVKAFDGVVAQHAQEPRLTEDAQMNEGELSGRLGLRGWPAVAEEAIIARDCLLAAHVGSRLHVCHVVHGRVGRDRPLGQEQGLERHRRGQPAPPAADRRARRDLRPDLQGQPAAALGVRRRGGPRGAGRRDDRHRRHRPRAAPARGQGLRVGGRRVRHARPRDRALGRAADDGRHRAASTGPASRSGCPPGRRRSAGSPATAVRSRWGSPPTSCSTTPRPPASSTAPTGLALAEQPVRRPGAARPRRRHVPAGQCPPSSTGSSRELAAATPRGTTLPPLVPSACRWPTSRRRAPVRRALPRHDRATASGSRPTGWAAAAAAGSRSPERGSTWSGWPARSGSRPRALRGARRDEDDARGQLAARRARPRHRLPPHRRRAVSPFGCRSPQGT